VGQVANLPFARQVGNCPTNSNPNFEVLYLAYAHANAKPQAHSKANHDDPSTLNLHDAVRREWDVIAIGAGPAGSMAARNWPAAG